MTSPGDLEVRGLSTGYGSIRALWDIDLSLAAGTSLVLLGPSGAGKSTLLRAIMGLLPLWGGDVVFRGESITNWPTSRRIASSISYVSERGIFPQLSVEDNLRVGGSDLSSREIRAALQQTWDQFPLLADRRRASAGDLSGGQRKLLGLAKALFRRPSLLLMDEPSAGLSPLLVNELVGTLAEVRARGGLTLLLAEQNAQVLELADRVSVLTGGRQGFVGTTEEFRAQTDVTAHFFGLHPSD